MIRLRCSLDGHRFKFGFVLVWIGVSPVCFGTPSCAPSVPSGNRWLLDTQHLYMTGRQRSTYQVAAFSGACKWCQFPSRKD